MLSYIKNIDKRINNKDMHNNSYKFFNNTDCKYYIECHDGIEKNCLFCFCPLYNYDCKQNPVFLQNGVKDCSNCTFPHDKDNYDKIIKFLEKVNSNKKL